MGGGDFFCGIPYSYILSEEIFRLFVEGGCSLGRVPS